MQTFRLRFLTNNNLFLWTSNEYDTPDNGGCLVCLVSIATEATQPEEQEQNDEKDDTGEDDSENDPRIPQRVFVTLWWFSLVNTVEGHTC
jgi:hypothetical protein